MSRFDFRYCIAAAALFSLMLTANPAFAGQEAVAPQSGPVAEGGAAPADSGPSLPASVGNANIQNLLSQILGANGAGAFAGLTDEQRAQAQQFSALTEQLAQQVTAQMKQLLESNGQNPGALPSLPVLPDGAAEQLRQLLDANHSGSITPVIPDAGQISAMADQFRQFLTSTGLGVVPNPEDLAASLASLKEKFENSGGTAPTAAPAQESAPAPAAPAPPLPQWPQ